LIGWLGRNRWPGDDDMNEKQEFTEFIKHLKESKGLNYEWPNAVAEAIAHLQEYVDRLEGGG